MVYPSVLDTLVPAFAQVENISERLNSRSNIHPVPERVTAPNHHVADANANLKPRRRSRTGVPPFKRWRGRFLGGPTSAGPPRRLYALRRTAILLRQRRR